MIRYLQAHGNGSRFSLQIEPLPEADLDATLRGWQAQDGKALQIDVPTKTLFARWAEEDGQMTDAEREAEDQLWQDFEKGINETRAVLGMISSRFEPLA